MRWELTPLALLASLLLAAAEPNETSPPGQRSFAVQALELEVRESALRLLEEDLERRLAELTALREEVSAVLAPGEEDYMDASPDRQLRMRNAVSINRSRVKKRAGRFK